jgi:hypothetical protein
VPGLVLALENHAETGGPVYTIHGRILHLYGLSAGRGGANGAAGYGVPLGEAFYENGGTAQRFSRGRITAGPEGDRFIPGDDPCLARLASLSPGERDREFGGVPPAAGEAFARAWAFTFTDREGESDGPIVRLTCPKPWIIQTREEDIAVTGFYVKSYNQGKDALVLVEGPPLPFRARRLGGAILSLLLRREKLPGIEGKRPLGTASGGGPLARSLAAGLAIYGPPLSDPLPFPAEEGGEARREAQRFGRGWLVLEGKREAPRMEADGE